MLKTEKILELAYANNISEIISLCKAALKEESIKNSGGSVKQYKASLKLLTENTNGKLLGAYIEDGKQYFTNGYIAFELYKPIENLPELSEKWDIKRFFAYPNYEYEKVETPDIANLRAEYKIAKAEKSAGLIGKRDPLFKSEHGKYIHKNENREWGCDIGNILIISDIIGDDAVWYLPSHKTLSMAVIENENGRALLFPISLKKD